MTEMLSDVQAVHFTTLSDATRATRATQRTGRGANLRACGRGRGKPRRGGKALPPVDQSPACAAPLCAARDTARGARRATRAARRCALRAGTWTRSRARVHPTPLSCSSVANARARACPRSGARVWCVMHTFLAGAAPCAGAHSARAIARTQRTPRPCTAGAASRAGSGAGLPSPGGITSLQDLMEAGVHTLAAPTPTRRPASVTRSKLF